MKLFHLSDLHIGKRVNEFSMLEDQKYILGQILKAAKEHQPEGIILAGDIYDKPVPAAEAVTWLLYMRERQRRWNLRMNMEKCASICCLS